MRSRFPPQNITSPSTGGIDATVTAGYSARIGRSIFRPQTKASSMKGPGFRRDLDVRRTWRCPICGTERKLPGDQTAVRCGCRPDGGWMTLVAERNAHPRVVNVMGAPEIPVADFQLTDEELATPLPGRIRRRPEGPPAPEGRPDRRPERGTRPPVKGPTPDAAGPPTPLDAVENLTEEVAEEGEAREPGGRPSRQAPHDRAPQERGPRRDGPRRGGPKREGPPRDRPVEGHGGPPPEETTGSDRPSREPAPGDAPRTTPPDETFGDGLV